MSSLIEKIVLLHQSLTQADYPHAFGGALALAWCTQQARGTIDIDINILVSVNQAEAIFNTLPVGIVWSEKELKKIVADGQIRLWWGKTPIDIFLNTTAYHEDLWQRVSWETFAEHQIPFLSCLDIAVFKAFFNRTKDRADLEAMSEAGTLDVKQVREILINFLGADDERIESLVKLGL